MSADDPIHLSDPLIGAQVGEYQIIEPVGEGGMGVVYRGIQPVIKKRVAIKVLKPQVAGDEQQVRRLIAEAESVNAIGHRGIIDIFGLGTLPDGRPYIVMEYLDGEALDAWLLKQAGGRLPLLTALELLLEICAPLAAAHRANVIHRDLKPSNVFVCQQKDGSRFLKILDFGLAKRALGDGNTKQTSQSVVSGTPDYMAPEQARGLSISPRSDIYALGVMAFEFFTGRVPFTGATPMDVMVAHVGSAPPDPKEFAPSLPDHLAELILRMLAKAPDDRPQSVEEVRASLEDAVVILGNPRPRGSGEIAAYVPGSGGETNAALRRRPPQTPNSNANFSVFDSDDEPLSTGVARSPLAPPLTPPPMAAAAPPTHKGAMWVGLVVVLGLVGAGVAFLLNRPQPAEPIGMVTAVDPPTLVEVDAGAAQAVAPVVVVDAGPALAAVGPPDAGVEIKPIKNRPPPPAPTTRQLKDRITRLAALAKKKKDLDPTALQFLGRYRIEAAAADTAVRRSKLDKSLTDWERSFLRK